MSSGRATIFRTTFAPAAIPSVDHLPRDHLPGDHHGAGPPSDRSPAPGVVGVGDAGDIFSGQFAAGAVDHGAQGAGVDEEDLPAPFGAAWRG